MVWLPDGEKNSNIRFDMIHEREKKIAVFTYRSPHFVSPGDAPATITQYVAWMERQFNACQTISARTYLSSIVSELYDAEVNA